MAPTLAITYKSLTFHLFTLLNTATTVQHEKSANMLFKLSAFIHTRVGKIPLIDLYMIYRLQCINFHFCIKVSVKISAKIKKIEIS